MEKNRGIRFSYEGRISLCARVLFTKGSYHITILYGYATIFLYYPVIKTPEPYIISMLYPSNTIFPHYPVVRILGHAVIGIFHCTFTEKVDYIPAY